MEPHDYKNGDVVRWDGQLWRLVLVSHETLAYLWNQFSEATVAIEELEFVGIDTLSDRAKQQAWRASDDDDKTSDHWASWKKPTKKAKKTKPEPKKDAIQTKDLIKREAERLQREKPQKEEPLKLRTSVLGDDDFKRSGPIPHREPKL